jgi:class 3 adenylate cyclase
MMPYPGSGQTGSGTPSDEGAVRLPLAAGVHGDAEPSGRLGNEAPFLRYHDDSGAQRVFVLDKSRPVTIGRAETVDLRLGWDRSVSSVHAEAYPLGTDWLISDEGISRNGTFVNSERLSGRRRLHHGDVIRVGRTALTYNEVIAERRDTTTIADGLSTTGTVTLLFTDLVGSTELMDRLGDDASDRLRRGHFAILRAAAAEHHGREVKNLGDGLMMAFPSALAAVACAVRMQQQIAAGNATAEGESIGLRIGLNAGEAISAGDDYFGSPVVVAKRLCDRADPGQVLTSEVVRALVGSRGGYRFTPLGLTSLKGFADPLSVFELDWSSHG